jgi:hypothetical protein
MCLFNLLSTDYMICESIAAKEFPNQYRLLNHKGSHKASKDREAHRDPKLVHQWSRKKILL